MVRRGPFVELAWNDPKELFHQSSLYWRSILFISLPRFWL